MTHLRILHAEDQGSIAETVDVMLRAHAPACDITMELARAETFADFKAMAFNGWDAILLDLTFEDSDIGETLGWMKEHRWKLGAVLVITGSERDEIYYRALECGAMRAILKPDFKAKEEIELKPRHLLMRIYESVLTRRAFSNYASAKPT